jgi:nucleoside-diphosphate-sugar epimerase
MDLMESCTILRASNVFGYEPDRKSFMGFCMHQLRDTGKIVYDINPYTVRDFIDVDTFVRILALVCELKPNDFYNVGSNLGLTVGDVSRYLIKGFGSGELDAKSDKFFDQFILSTNKLKTALEMDISPFNFEKIISKFGKRLYEDRI